MHLASVLAGLAAAELRAERLVCVLDRAPPSFARGRTRRRSRRRSRCSVFGSGRRARRWPPKPPPPPPGRARPPPPPRIAAGIGVVFPVVPSATVYTGTPAARARSRALRAARGCRGSGGRPRGRGSRRACSPAASRPGRTHASCVPAGSALTELPVHPTSGARPARRSRARRRSRCRRSRGRSSTSSIASRRARGRSSAASPPAPRPRRATSPTFSRGGTLSRKVCSARCAATSRVGFTSIACIEPETSSTSTTVALSLATSVVHVRARDRDAERREREQEDAGGEPAPPRPAGRDDRREHVDVRVPHRVAHPAPRAATAVDARPPPAHEQRQEQERMAEAHRARADEVELDDGTRPRRDVPRARQRRRAVCGPLRRATAPTSAAVGGASP